MRKRGRANVPAPPALPADVGALLRAASLQARHRLFEHLLIQFEADFSDMARLFLAKQVSRSPDIEVVACKAEARAELIQGLHDLEPALRGFGQRLARRSREIGVAAQLRPPDPSPQLIELRQAEHVGAVEEPLHVRLGQRTVEPDAVEIRV